VGLSSFHSVLPCLPITLPLGARKGNEQSPRSHIPTVYSLTCCCIRYQQGLNKTAMLTAHAAEGLRTQASRVGEAASGDTRGSAKLPPFKYDKNAYQKTSTIEDNFFKVGSGRQHAGGQNLNYTLCQSDTLPMTCLMRHIFQVVGAAGGLSVFIFAFHSFWTWFG